MQLELKLYGGRGELIPRVFTCISNDTLKIVPNKTFSGHTALVIGENSYPLENGMFCVPSEDLGGFNSCEVQEYNGGTVKTRYKISNICATPPPTATDYATELDFWKNKYEVATMKIEEYENTIEAKYKEFETKLNEVENALISQITKSNARIAELETKVNDAVAF